MLYVNTHPPARPPRTHMTAVPPAELASTASPPLTAAECVPSCPPPPLLLPHHTVNRLACPQLQATLTGAGCVQGPHTCEPPINPNTLCQHTIPHPHPLAYLATHDGSSAPCQISFASPTHRCWMCPSGDHMVTGPCPLPACQAARPLLPCKPTKPPRKNNHPDRQCCCHAGFDTLQLHSLVLDVSIW
jgi:hypothetical protein